MKLHPVIEAVTQRIRERSAPTRSAYLALIKAAASRDRGADRMGCANVAHAFAALPANDKFKVVAEKAPNIAIVNAYNDMLSAHAPLAGFPSIIKDELRKHGATAQVAGGVPAMCDGVTQGTAGMELSLFSRDNIAQGTAIALSHDVFDGALMLGVCDKIVPGLLIGALHFGHLPMVFVPAGPMTSGLSNNEKAKVREQAAQGLVGRKELLEAESKAYHGPGTCTFYGTANSNQMLLEAMGLHVPGTAFVNPDEATGGNLRELLTREAARTVLAATKQAKRIGELVDERCIVNAMVALLATGGSTNHLIHWVAVARAAGIIIDWNDFSQLSDCVPLLSRVYPNGSADVNQFQAAGGPGFVIRELIDAGFMHADVATVSSSLREFTKIPTASDNKLVWNDTGVSKDTSVVRPAAEPFSATGGLKLLQGNLGRSVIKVSAVPEDRHIVEAPARVFDSQEAMLAAFKAGEMERDMVVVVRWQGPRANGMPELHKLTPPLAVLQGKGFKVALVTDGRMSGASGKVPAAIHVSPEALGGGPLAKLRDGDIVRLDGVAGTLQALVSEAEWASRPLAQMPVDLTHGNGLGMGRELFAASRRNALSAEEGACSWL
ncbi:phosphogluconate dehydratase [Variovorax sp. PCZ-1]|uniref:phosphogluconate dehydratase n=1 Tax=Variovorax sp. PCZ-1 TaxID=2835533 RepID=UPI001BD1441A|nr:phosphogluconate dehydratase [Variovorax sp. PCZ-1]MBS7808113.1 phosphogluconate dehydratase [Variovorax sp. PCZ-1]